jgi:hypothetical protein
MTLREYPERLSESGFGFDAAPPEIKSGGTFAVRAYASLKQDNQ